MKPLIIFITLMLAAAGAIGVGMWETRSVSNSDKKSAGGAPATKVDPADLFKMPPLLVPAEPPIGPVVTAEAEVKNPEGLIVEGMQEFSDGIAPVSRPAEAVQFLPAQPAERAIQPVEAVEVLDRRIQRKIEDILEVINRSAGAGQSR